MSEQVKQEERKKQASKTDTDRRTNQRLEILFGAFTGPVDFANKPDNFVSAKLVFCNNKMGDKGDGGNFVQ